MHSVYELYAGDAAGLRAITCRFLEGLELLKTQAPGWYRKQQWELLHRHTHQVKASAALYELTALFRLLEQISRLTHTQPVDIAALETPICQLPAAVDEAVALVQNQLNHVS